LCPLSVNPCPAVRRTGPEFDAPTFAEYQEIDRSAVDHSDLLEIDGDGSVCLIDSRHGLQVQRLCHKRGALLRDVVSCHRNENSCRNEVSLVS
jgi:hypothetical protein